MRSRIVILAVAVVLAVAAVVAATSLRKIPAGTQVLVLRDGAQPQVLSEGWHFAPSRSAKRISYPAGPFSFDFPQKADFAALNAEARDTEVGMHLALRIPDDSAAHIHRYLGEDLERSLEATLERLVAVHAGDVPTGAADAVLVNFLENVSNALADVLRPAGIEIVACDLTRWQVVGDFQVDQELATPYALRKVVLLGIDGADWTILDPLMAAGKLPNFARLVREGATGPLRSFEPLLSPLLWTTMATGKLPEEHGVLNFNVTNATTGEKELVNRTHRRVDALWNFLGDFGRSVDVVGWIASHPPERVNGCVVSDRLGLIAQGQAAAERLSIEDVVYPSARAAEIEPLVLRRTQLRPSDVERFMNIGEDEFKLALRMADHADRSISHFLSLYASAHSYHAITKHLLQKDAPELLAVYLDFVDASCHLFMPAAPPQRPELSDEEFARFSGGVEAVYREQDRMLGEIMELCGDGTILMVVSDHGFKSGEARLRGRSEAWTGKAPMWHRLDGIVGVWGDGARRGARIEGATLLDVAPTLLALSGLPGVEDVHGEVLEQAFEPELIARFNPIRVASLERRRPDETTEWVDDPMLSAEITKKLQALGYISTSDESTHSNLGARYQEQGEYEKAIQEYRKALESASDDHTLLNNLAICLDKTGRYQEAEDTYLAVLTLNPRDVYAMNNLAVFYLDRRQPQRAGPWAEKAVGLEPNYANAHVTLGSAFGLLGQLDKAAAEFERVLEIEPENERARNNLQRIRDAQARSGQGGR